MKDKQWNFLTLIVVLVSGLFGCLFTLIYLNPYVFFNPLPPPVLPELIVLPTSTATLKQLPQLWTNTPGPGGQQNILPDGTLRPSSTPIPSSTGFRLPSATPTATNTSTETSTPTVTNTPSPTSSPTRTRTITATFTLIPSNTLESPTDTSVPPTATTEVAYP